MSNLNISYPFDPTGTEATNLVLGELKVIAPPELTDFYTFIPDAAPFFADTLKLYHMPSNRELIQGVDWLPVYYFHDASLQCAKPIYGGFTLMGEGWTGALRLERYQTLGGDWTLNIDKITQILSEQLVNPRRVMWEQVADLPYAFPPIDHDWNLQDMVGMSETVAELREIRLALEASGASGLATHLADFDNPHQVTAEQVGLGFVANFPIANVSEAQDGILNTRYMTPLRTAQLITAMIGTELDDHINRSDNPHNVTKTHVGLGNVDNYATATNGQTVSGTATNLFVTPAGVSAVISGVIGPMVAAHADRTDNPHGVTKGQVGLGSVDNFVTADAVVSRLGQSNAHFMTPAGTREAIQALVGDSLISHVNDTDNPHGTNKVHVGLGSVENYPIASLAVAQEGVSNAHYMTPLRVADYVAATVGQGLTNHLNDSDNPHGTTKAQVGLSNVDNFATASEQQAVQGLATNLFMTPATTRALIVALGGGGGAGGNDPRLDGHLLDTDNPHDVTKAQVGLGNVDNFATADSIVAAAGNSDIHFMTPAGVKAAVQEQVGTAFTAHAQDQNNPHGLTAAQVGAYDTDEVDSLLNDKLDTTARAADSAMLEGLSLAQTLDAARPQVFYPTATSSPGYIWTQLGEITYPTALALDQGDIVADITGGEPATFGVSSTYRLVLALRNLSLSTLTVGSEAFSRETAFGYVREVNGADTTVRLFVRALGGRAPVIVTPVAEKNRFFTATTTINVNAPAGIVYLAYSLPPFARPRAIQGDVTFGDLPGNFRPEQVNGSLIEYVSVASTDAEELTARVVENDIEQEYGDFYAWSGRGANYLYSDMSVLDQWGWNSTANGILLDADTVEGNAMLHSPKASTNYRFEVEISSTSTEANGAGVLAAVVNVGNRPHAISLVRTPGGLAVQANAGGLKFKLKQVALHVDQGDEINLGSTHGLLAWGDTGAPDENRDPTTYTGDGWDAAGTVRIRVTRTGNVLELETTDFGSATYLAGEKVTIDLANTAGLADFVDRPSFWGVISVRQPKTTFRFLQRPSRYRDYVRVGHPDDNGRQRFYRFNGTGWDMSYLGLTNPVVRPNRFYYSDWNGVFYHAQRNGRLQPILIEAYMRANANLVTI